MNGKGRDWAIALGGIALLGLAGALAVNLSAGRERLSALVTGIERWKAERAVDPSARPEQSTGQSTG